MKELMKEFLEKSRWFGGKGREFQVTGARRLRMPGGEADPAVGRTVVIELVTVEYADGHRDLYQVPVAYYTGEQVMLHHALIGEWDDEELGHVWGYDALHDHAATPLWLHAFAAAPDVTASGAGTPEPSGTGAEVRFRRVGDPQLDPDARSTLLTGEQSNSSVAFGDESLMKLFRRVTPGQNPDIEILAALTEAGNEHIAALYGWVETATEDGADEEVLQLGILQQFLRTASDGWGLALASLRNLYASAELSAEEAGGDFAAEAHRLGMAVGEMHEALAAYFPTETWDRPRLGELADAMSARLEAAQEAVPQLEPLAPALHAKFDALRHLDHQVVAQRVHGDLHLGQTLRTVKNWKIIDFEGEPAKPLEERRRPDSPWRDVAGMLRSFDYAAEMTRMDHDQAAGDADEHTAERAREWSARNLAAFLAGYREAGAAEVDEVLVTAYTVDKAVYEALYEARNRPSWLPIPLAALSRLASAD